MAKEIKRVASYAKYEKLRKKAGLTDYGVWKATGVPRTSIYEWKKGIRPINDHWLIVLADFLKVDKNDLTKKA